MAKPVEPAGGTETDSLNPEVQADLSFRVRLFSHRYFL